jgi:hypothetical protein
VTGTVDRAAAAVDAAVDLYWIPLGAGGHSVRFNGIVYEAVSATIQRRPRSELYHCALQIRVATGLYTVEMTPVPNRRGWERGVVVEGAVGARWAGRLRIFRYEVRRWRDGVIPDLHYAIGGPIRLTEDALVADHILELLPCVPALTWGRDESEVGEMWSCNSIISWALSRAGVDTDAILLPPRGRAPGWNAGISIATKPAAPLATASVPATALSRRNDRSDGSTGVWPVCREPHGLVRASGSTAERCGCCCRTGRGGRSRSRSSAQSAPRRARRPCP